MAEPCRDTTDWATGISIGKLGQRATQTNSAPGNHVARRGGTTLFADNPNSGAASDSPTAVLSALECVNNYDAHF